MAAGVVVTVVASEDDSGTGVGCADKYKKEEEDNNPFHSSPRVGNHILSDDDDDDADDGDDGVDDEKTYSRFVCARAEGL